MTIRKQVCRPNVDGQAIYENLKICGYEKLVRQVALEHKILPKDMLGQSKRESHSLARAHLVTVIRHTLGTSYPELADLLGYAGPGAVRCAENRWGAQLEKRYGYRGPWTEDHEARRRNPIQLTG